MADRYWVGGTASWDATAGTKWALTSGGAGGQAVPTSSDDVYFDGTSGSATVTVSGSRVCNNLNFTSPSSFTGTFAGTGGLTISGSMTLASGMGRTYTGSIIFNATATGKTLTFNTVSIASFLTFNGTGGGWTLQDTLTSSSSGGISLLDGSLDINGTTVSLSAGGFSTSGTGTKVITLGASSFTCTGWNIGGSGNTVNPNTAIITMTGATTFTGGGATYTEVRFTHSGGLGQSIIDSNTFGTLKAENILSHGSLSFHDNQTVTTALVLTGNNSSTERLTVGSNTRGLQRTITCNGTVTITNVDFDHVVAAGSFGTWSGTSIGNRGGNSNITFTAAVTRYWVGNGGAWINTTHWASSSGGAGTASFPLPQDSVVFDANSFSSGGQTVNAGTAGVAFAAMDWTNVTNSPTFSLDQSVNFFGNVTLAAGMTLTSTGTKTLDGLGNHTLNMAGLSFGGGNLSIEAVQGGSWTLTNHLINSGSTGTLSLVSGSFDADVYDVTFPSFSSSQTTVNNSLYMGSGTWTITGNTTPWNSTSNVVHTVYGETSTIKVTGTFTANRSFFGGGKTFNNLWIAHSGAFSFIWSGSGTTFNNIRIDAGKLVRVTAGHTIVMSSLTAFGNASSVITIDSSSAGSQGTFSCPSGLIECDWLSLKDNNATGGATWYAGANSAVVSNVTGWDFVRPNQAKAFTNAVRVVG